MAKTWHHQCLFKGRGSKEEWPAFPIIKTLTLGGLEYSVSRFASRRCIPADGKRWLGSGELGKPGLRAAGFSIAGWVRRVSKIPDSWKFHQSSRKPNKLSFQPGPSSTRSDGFLPSYWSSSYFWSVSCSLVVIFWKKSICWRRWCCIWERKSRIRVRWKCWISASVAQEMMLQRSWSSLSCFGQSFTLVRAPGGEETQAAALLLHFVHIHLE